MKSLILAPSGNPARLQAYYEAAQWSPRRQQNWTVLQPSSKDLDPATLYELARNSRDCYKNGGIIHGVIERMITYVVGTGLFPLPASSDKAWNALAFETIQPALKYPQANKKGGWGKVCRKILREMFLDGTHFIQKTTGPSGRRRINLIRYDRLAKNGIKFDRFGRAQSFTFKDENGKELPPIPSEFIVQISNDLYSDSNIGEPVLTPILNTVRDVQEIINWEKAAVKDNGTKRDVIKRAVSEFDGESIIRAESAPVKASSTVQDAYYQNKLGPESIMLEPGDDYQLVVSNRPSPAWTGFMDFLCNTICQALNVPPSILLQIKVGGADTRRDAAAAQRVWEVWQSEMVDALQEIYEWFIDGEIQDGALMNAPKDWRKCSWQTTRSISVDAGREAQQDRADVAAGLMTEEEYHGRWGMYWLKVHEQRETESIDWIQRAKRISESEKIPFETALEILSKRDISPTPEASNAQQQTTGGAQ